MENVNNSLCEYPRPQFQRENWMNLNGEWNFAFDDGNCGESQKWFTEYEFPLKIKVPFVYESKASGIGDTAFHDNIWYQRSFIIPKGSTNKHVILNFKGVDYHAKVWVNGNYVGCHTGGYAAFEFDITNFISKQAENSLVVKVEDSKSRFQPRGKQRWMDDNFGCWYVQSTGIWKTVWLEFVEESRIESVKITPDFDHSSVEFNFDLKLDSYDSVYTVQTEITFAGNLIRKFALTANNQNLSCKIGLSDTECCWAVMPWEPQMPNLYDVKFTLLRGSNVFDEVASYFGLRKISIDKGRIYINNHELYQRLILNQGYWKDSLLTPPSEEAIIEDIDLTMKMGFNGMRIHQKIEDERFLYWCDKKGMLVWSEMAAAYEYSDEAVSEFTKEWLEIVKQNYNHPCIITWTPFNESWGIHSVVADQKQQSFTESIYHLTKAFDSMRPVITNDGWEHTVSDILTIHDYEEIAPLLKEKYEKTEKLTDNSQLSGSGKKAIANDHVYRGQPIIISEYGGIALNTGKGWGYGKTVTSEEEYIKRFERTTNAIKSCKDIVGYCYTQLTDVQQEVNGLLTEDRVPKVDTGKIREVNEHRDFILEIGDEKY